MSTGSANSPSVAALEVAIGCKSDSIAGYESDVSGSLASIQAIDFRGYRGGEIVRRSGSTGTVTIYTSPTLGGAFGPKQSLVQGEWTTITITISGNDAPRDLPPGVFGSHWIKLVGDAAGVFDIALKG